MKKSAGIAYAALLALLLAVPALPAFAAASTTVKYVSHPRILPGSTITLWTETLEQGDRLWARISGSTGSLWGTYPINFTLQQANQTIKTASFYLGPYGYGGSRTVVTFALLVNDTAQYRITATASSYTDEYLTSYVAVTYTHPVYSVSLSYLYANGTQAFPPESSAVEQGLPFTLSAPSIKFYSFTGWKGTGPGSYTGPLQEATITPLGNVTETATYYSYNPYAALYGTYIAPYFDQPLSLFVLTVSLLSALFLTRVLSLDPNQARHMGMVIAAVALLDAVGFPFVYYDASCFQSPPGCIGANVPLRLTGSWVIGSYPIYPSFLITSVIAPAIVAAALLISSEKKGVITTPMPAGEGGEHRFIAAIYIVFAFLMRDYYLQLLFLSLYQPGLPYYYDLWWFRGLTTVLIALPLWALTMPKAPIGSWQTPSRRVVGFLGVLSIAAFITASRTFLFQQPMSTLSLLTSHSQNLTYTQISPPLFVALSVAGLLAWRRPWRVNGLFTAAFFFSGVSTFLLLLLASLNVSFSISYAPVFVLLSFPAMALVYRHYKSKLWVLLALITSLFGLPSLIVYAVGVYELIFNVRALPSLKAPAFSKSRTQLKDEELKKEEEKKEE